MKNNSFRFAETRNPAIVIQEALLLVFIVISPIYKNLKIVIFGYNIVTIVIGMLLVSYASIFVSGINNRQSVFGGLSVLFVFCFEIIFISKNNHIGWVLTVLLYAAFLQTDKRLSFERLYKAFLVSSIGAALFSLTKGLAGGSITRVADSVDGSIAPITVVLVLFFDSHYTKKQIQPSRVLKILAMISSIIVAVFGMSRARILIVLVCFLCYCYSKFRGVMRSGGRVKQSSIYMILAISCVIIVFASTEWFQTLCQPLWNRFVKEGLTSSGRDVETAFAIRLFKENVVCGGGWQAFYFQNDAGSWVGYENHNAYLAVLARGGLVMAIPTFISYLILLKKSYQMRASSMLALVMMIVFFLLSYGNAGMFNYTICSIIPLVVVDIKKEASYEKGKYTIPAER